MFEREMLRVIKHTPISRTIITPFYISPLPHIQERIFESTLSVVVHPVTKERSPLRREMRIQLSLRERYTVYPLTLYRFEKNPLPVCLLEEVFSLFLSRVLQWCGQREHRQCVPHMFQGANVALFLLFLP